MGKLWGNVSNNCGEIGENNEKNCGKIVEKCGNFGGNTVEKEVMRRKLLGNVGKIVRNGGICILLRYLTQSVFFFSNTC